MAEQEVSQQDLFSQLEKEDVKVDKSTAEVMKEKILNDTGSKNYLGIGVHEVTVTGVELAQAKTGTLGMKFLVENDEGSSDVTMWLSEGALPYTIENVSRLLVHNAAEDKKDEARNYMSNIVSAKEVYSVMTDTLLAREKSGKPFMAYLSIREDKTGRTYTDKNGVEKPSLERNLLSYKPKETAVQAAVAVTGGEPLTKDALEGLPF